MPGVVENCFARSCSDCPGRQWSCQLLQACFHPVDVLAVAVLAFQLSLSKELRGAYMKQQQECAQLYKHVTGETATQCCCCPADAQGMRNIHAQATCARSPSACMTHSSQPSLTGSCIQLAQRVHHKFICVDCHCSTHLLTWENQIASLSKPRGLHQQLQTGSAAQ